MEKLNKYKFQPGARSIIQMGEELIGHPTTAINELVKNGYDADATKSTVYLNYSKDKHKSFIAISDNGLGMDNNTLFGDWLKPSVSSKRNNESKSKVFQRNFLGSKGIGRLASMALGRFLTVISKTSNEKEFNWILIDRNAFKRDDNLLSEIEFPGGISNSILSIFADEKVLEEKNGNRNQAVIDYTNNFLFDTLKEGTIIIVEELDDSILTIVEDGFLNGDKSIEDISLIRSLKTLITPLTLNQTIQDELINKKILEKKNEISLPESFFEIYFGCNLLGGSSYKDQFIKISHFSVLENFDYRLLGKVNKNGSVNGIYICNRLFEDSFEVSLTLSGDETHSDEYSRKRNIKEIQGQIIEKQGVGEFFFDIRVYDRDPDSMDKLSKILKTVGRRDTAAILDRFVGLRISKNGFGVKPYGDEEQDWMQLGEMRVQNPSAILGTNQIIGNIFLYSPENDKLNEKTNREGFFENEAFITFKKILRSILIETGKLRFNYRQKHSLGRKVTSKNERPDTTRFIEFIGTITTDPNKINEAKAYFNEVTTTLDNLENSLTFSQRLAALGSGLELVYHEMAQPTSLIGKCLMSLKYSIAQVEKQNLKDELLNETKQIKNAIETLDKLKESLEPAIGRSKKSEFLPLHIFNKICYLFTKDLATNNIKIEIDKSLERFTIKDTEYVLWISFLNILNNAVYWLKTENKTHKIISFKKGIGNELIISNNGPKIENGELENIFNYGVTHKKIKNATGLGLAFTRSILSSNDWEIWAENDVDGPSFKLKKIE